MMVVSGILIAGKTQPLIIDFQKFYEIFFTLISVFYAVVYSTISNNFADIKIDSISNPGRPLPKQSVDAGEYSKAGKIILVLSLFFGLTASFKIFIVSFLFMFFYHIYSKPPIRFKRFFIISKICISINSMILSFAGYLIFKNNLESYPAIFICFFLIVLTLVINFIDLKDFDGDKADNIKTIPVVFGLKNAKIICGFFFIFTYIIAAFEFV
ncbi:MAG TPA: UbiA family prenyltransferase, partial [bacterium]|nr:UbiA family prenyltransferase [bacterium]